MLTGARMSKCDAKKLQKVIERILYLISIAFVIGAFNVIVFAYNDDSMFIGGIIVIVISILLSLLSKRIAKLVAEV